jgi:hypothetical protein
MPSSRKLYIRKLLYCKEENYIVCMKMNGIEDHHVELNNPDSEKTSMFSLICGI